MPRAVDPKIEGRILKAAMKLWNQGGEDALSMRKVAIKATTSTPTIYERFVKKNADDLPFEKRPMRHSYLIWIQQTPPRRFSHGMWISVKKIQDNMSFCLGGDGKIAGIRRICPVLYFDCRRFWKERVVIERKNPRRVWRLQSGHCYHGTVMLRIAVAKTGSNWPLVKKSCLKSCEILKESV